MTTRDERLSNFSTGTPASDGSFELLCEDKRGTYALPYPCDFSDGWWRNTKTGDRIEASVIGWRPL